MNLWEEAAIWRDTENFALAIRDRFNTLVHVDVDLWAHRQFTGPRGMGEDAFHWMWKLLVDAMPDPFRFMEVGVFKGQILSLVKFLADRTGKGAEIYGVTMLNRFAGTYPLHPDCDYYKEIVDLHAHFGQAPPELIVGDSTHDEIHAQVEALPLFDMIFVDACHDYDFVAKDLVFYAPRIKRGGFLITDDSANNLRQPFGFFQGIDDVTKAVLTIIATDPQWEHVLTVCHDRVFRKVE